MSGEPNGTGSSSHGAPDQNLEQKNKQKQKQIQRQRQGEKQKQKQKQKQGESQNEKKTEPGAEINTTGTSHPNDKDSKKEGFKPKKNRNKKSQKEESQKTSTPAALATKASESPNSVETLKKLKKRQKRQQQRQRKKEAEKKNNTPPVPKLPVFKITVRKLPPKLSKQSFIDQLYSAHPEFKDHITETYYVNGYLPDSQFEQHIPSRCYINCTNDQTMMIVGRGIKGMIFKNDNLTVNKTSKSEENNNDTKTNDDDGTGNTKNDNDQSEIYDEDMETYTPIIEKSVYQAMPALNKEDGSINVDKWDFFNNKLEDIAIYQRFCEIISDSSRTQLPRDIFEYEREYELKKKEEELKIKNASKNNKKKKKKSKNKNKSKANNDLTPAEQAKQDDIIQKKRQKKRRKRERERQKKLEEAKKAKE